MMRWILDTNIISKAIRGTCGTRARVQSQPKDHLLITAVTVAELTFGSLKAGNPERHRARWQMFTAGMTVLPFDAAAADVHAHLRRHLRQQPIGERDLLIAAIAQANKHGVITNNRAEFARIPDLKIEDWSE